MGGGDDDGGVYTASSRGAWWAVLRERVQFDEQWEVVRVLSKGYVVLLVLSGDCCAS